MARPGNKTLLGREGGNSSHHWYDFIKSRTALKRSKIWDGGCPGTRPGVKWAVWLGFLDGKEVWGSAS